MEGIKLANDKYFGGEELFRGLFGKYGNDIYKMLLARYNDPQVAREMLKNIFQEAYLIIVEAGTIDITSLWLKALAESVVSKQQRPALAAQPTMAQPTMAQPTMAQPTIAQPTIAQPTITQPTITPPSIVPPPTPQAPFMQAQAAPPTTPQAPFMQAQAAPLTTPQAPFMQAQAPLAQTPAAQVKPPPGFIRSVQPSYEPYIPSGKLQEKEKPRNTGRIILLGGLSVMILFTVWMLVGLLMDVQVIPNMDLGYGWFNQNVFNLF